VLLASDLSRHLDPVLFAADAGLTLDPWQASLVREQPRRAILCCSRQSGKSTTVSVLALSIACGEPDSLICIASPSQRQSDELLLSICKLHNKMENVPEKKESVRKIEFENGSRILSLPGSNDGKTIRGLSNCRLVLIDECAGIDDELMSALRPMLIVNQRGSLIMLGTPKGRRGIFFDTWHNGDPMWTRIQVTAAMCPRITPEKLAEERKALGETRFQEEYMLAFLDSGVAAFPTDLIDAMFTADVKPLWS
jgi:hypothetical protein